MRDFCSGAYTSVVGAAAFAVQHHHKGGGSANTGQGPDFVFSKVGPAKSGLTLYLVFLARRRRVVVVDVAKALYGKYFARQNSMTRSRTSAKSCCVPSSSVIVNGVALRGHVPFTSRTSTLGFFLPSPRCLPASATSRIH